MAAHRARTPLLAALTALSAACASGSQKPPYESPPVPESHIAGTICGVRPRADTRDSVLQDPLDDMHYRDGCSRREIVYGLGEEESPGAAPLLAALAEEMGRIPRLTEVEIVVAAGKGEDVRVLARRFHRIVEALGELGVAPGRLSRAYQPADNAPGYVMFVPFACDGQEIVRRSDLMRAR